MHHAHSREGLPEDKWQPLEDHLNQVAGLAGAMAAPFGAQAWARVAGLLHDLGKATQPFQDRLRGGPKVDHASAGAQEAKAKFGPQAGRLLAYALAGHHGGLPDAIRAEGPSLEERLHKEVPPLLEPQPPWPEDLTLPTPFLDQGGNWGFQLAFFTRMVFSCLVDADWLDTEAFMDPDKAACAGAGRA